MKNAFMFDAAFPNSLSGRRLIKKYGHQGFSCFVLLCCYLWQAEDDEPRFSELEDVADLIRVDADLLKQVVTFLIEEFVFACVPDEGFWYPAMRADKEKLESKRETYRNNRLGKGKSIDKQLLNDSKSIVSECKNESIEPEQEPEPDPETDLEPKPEPEAKTKPNPAFETKAVVVSRSKPEPGACEIAPGVWVDEITRETTLMAFQAVGLAAEDMPRAGQILSRHYDGNPNRKRRSDIHASWVIQELLKEKTTAVNLENAKSRGKPKPPDDPYAEAKRKFLAGEVEQ